MTLASEPTKISVRLENHKTLMATEDADTARFWELNEGALSLSNELRILANRISSELGCRVVRLPITNEETTPANRPACLAVSVVRMYEEQHAYENEECVYTRIPRICLLFGTCLCLLNIERPDFRCGA